MGRVSVLLLRSGSLSAGGWVYGLYIGGKKKNPLQRGGPGFGRVGVPRVAGVATSLPQGGPVRWPCVAFHGAREADLNRPFSEDVFGVSQAASLGYKRALGRPWGRKPSEASTGAGRPEVPAPPAVLPGPGPRESLRAGFCALAGPGADRFLPCCPHPSVTSEKERSEIAAPRPREGLLVGT